MRLLMPAFLLLGLLAPAAQAADSLNQRLLDVARNSSAGTPRAMNADILDFGYSVDGHRLVNHLKVRPDHAVQMRLNIDSVRSQLRRSVCSNSGFVSLMGAGATLVYDFSEMGQEPKMVTIEYFTIDDCTR